MRAAGDVLNDVVKILRLNFGVPTLFWIEDNVWSFLARAETHVWFDLDVRNPFGGNFFLELRRKLFRTARLAIDVLANQANSSHYFSPRALITRPNRDATGQLRAD